MPELNSKITATGSQALNARSASLGLAGTAQLMAGFAAIALLHVLAGFTLYGGRVAQLGEIFFSDRLVLDCQQSEPSGCTWPWGSIYCHT
jgi:hypothetical protein